MPFIREFKCKNCDFSLPRGWGMTFYIINEQGIKRHCNHPSEGSKLTYYYSRLGKEMSFEQFFRENTGCDSDCICLDCLYQFKADLGEHYLRPKFTAGRDKRECPRCKLSNVETTLAMVGKVCPSCNMGIIEEEWTGAIS